MCNRILRSISQLIHIVNTVVTQGHALPLHAVYSSDTQMHLLFQMPFALLDATVICCGMVVSTFDPGRVS